MKVISKDEKKKEAIERLKMLKLDKHVLDDFEKEDLINVSERGILYWINDYQREMIREFEEKYNALVYHVIHDFTAFGELYSLLYVSDYKSEWKTDRNDIKDGFVLAYVKNMDADFCSEFGSIGIKEHFGGLIRTA